jgi:raffinose/stachyose/melibiose transport system substrate-binding protein
MHFYRAHLRSNAGELTKIQLEEDMNVKTLRGWSAATIFALMSSAAFADQVTLDVTAWKGNETEPAGLKQIIAKFEAANPEIKVELSYISRSDTDIVIPPRLQGGTPPDVLMVDMQLAKLWGDAGLLADQGPGSEWYGRVAPDLKTAILRDGKAYVLPLEVIGMGLFSNMALLKKVGIEKAPVTLEDLKAACGALDAAGIKPLLMPGGFPSALTVIANGLEATTTPVADFGNGTAKFVDDAGFNSALDMLRDLAAAKCFDPAEMAGIDPWTTGLSEFKAGRFAMLPQGAWNLGNFRGNKDLDFTFGPIPSKSGVGVAADLLGIGWALSAAGKHQDAATKFVDFFAQTENLQILLDDEAAYSPFTDGASGMPALAANYDASRSHGGTRNYPFNLLQWPTALDAESGNSLAGFLLNLDQDNAAILQRWDTTVEDNL